MVNLKISISIALFGVFFFILLFHIPTKFFSNNLANEEYEITVSEGDTAKSVSMSIRKKQNFIQAQLFQFGTIFFRIDKNLKSGEFVLNSNMSIRMILDKISQGKSKQYEVKIKECITNWELFRLLQNQVFIQMNIELDEMLEGHYAPNTYIVGYNTKASDFLNLMKNKQDKILEKEWTERSKQQENMSKNELLILASIIEKEAADKLEMPKISSVYVNRLKKKMRLESDPTVTYGLDLGNIEKRKKLVLSDLKKTNEYNTYRKSGLPKTPICNPSKYAIESAAKPAKTENLFFVLNKLGKHVFSTNYEDHKKHVKKLRAYQTE